MYAPYTTKGELMVNGVSASSYIALEDFDGVLSYDMQGWLHHMLNAPLRVGCYTGWYCPSHEGTHYDAETGFSSNTMFQMRLKSWFFDGHARAVQLGFMAAGCAMLWSVEQLVMSGQARLMAALLVFAAWKLLQSKKIQSAAGKVKIM